MRRRRAYERERARRQRELRRRRQIAFAAVLLGACALAALIALVAVPALRTSPTPAAHDGTAGNGGNGGGKTESTTTTTSTKPPAPPGPPFAVGVRTMRFVDTSRTVDYRNGTTGPRVLNTEIRYPATGRPGGRSTPNAAPQRASGPFPLIVFGHGYQLLPVDYRRLLNAWASAGYVVAAPVFPDENTDAPGGPEEQDLVNQPGDMKFVISEMLGASGAATGPMRGLIEPEEIAVAGHSDGGDTALAVAYDEYEGLRDAEVKAAVILSGARIPALPAFAFPEGGPPLLATQGSLDNINHPYETAEYFEAAHPPKYLLELIGTGHLEPYTYAQPWLGIVEKVSIDFLNHYLKAQAGSLHRMLAAGSSSGVASLRADR